jgi:hypothetical protein
MHKVKKTTSRAIFNLDYIEFNDGCLVLSEKYSHKDLMSGRHRNDNAIIIAEINRFNSEIRRLNPVSENDIQEIFNLTNRTEIGSWYFVYRLDQRYGNKMFPPGMGGVMRSESCVTYSLAIWRVDVVRR